MHPSRRVVLIELGALLERIGVANDAQDHGSTEEAERLRSDACESIRRLIAQHAFLTEQLPTLRWELDSRHILGFGWSNLQDGVEAGLEVTGMPPK